MVCHDCNIVTCQFTSSLILLYQITWKLEKTSILYKLLRYILVPVLFSILICSSFYDKFTLSFSGCHKQLTRPVPTYGNWFWVIRRNVMRNTRFLSAIRPGLVKGERGSGHEWMLLMHRAQQKNEHKRTIFVWCQTNRLLLFFRSVTNGCLICPPFWFAPPTSLCFTIRVRYTCMCSAVC